MSATTTLAPSSAQRSAVALPMPTPPPVIKATLPASRAIAFASPQCRLIRCGCNLAVFLRDEIVGQRKAGHGFEPTGPGFDVGPTANVDAAFRHEYHAPPTA